MREIRRSLAQALLSCTSYQPGSETEFAFGQAFHKVPPIFHHTDLEMDEIAHSVYFDTPGSDPERWPEFQTLCERYAITHARTLPRQVLYLEEKLSVETEAGILVGTPDRVDRLDDSEPGTPPVHVGAVDYKTSWYAEGHQFQGRWYGTLVCLLNPSVQTFTWAPDHFRRNPDNTEEPVTWTRSQLLRWWAEITAALALKLKETPKPTGGVACNYCGLRYRCASATPEAQSIPENDDQAEEVVQDLIRHKAAVKERTTALRAYLGDRVPLVAAGHEIGFLVAKKPTWKPKASPFRIKAWLDRRGCDGKAVLAVDASAINPEHQRQMALEGLGEFAKGDARWDIRKATPAPSVQALKEAS